VEQEQQITRGRILSFIRELVPAWHPSREQILWTVRIVIVLVVILGILTLIGLPFGITLWKWLKLLIVPAVIAAGGLWFNRQQRDRELEIADQRAHDEALQSYFDQMSQLLLDKDRPLRQSEEGDEARTLARARTLSLLTRLDGARKAQLVQFLYESGLIANDRRLVDLSGADLRRADLYHANLYGADLRGAHLYGADLSHANLYRADLSHANLNEANLRWAALRRAFLSGTSLSGAGLIRTNLYAANLSGAKGITKEQLEHVKSLEGATIPDGQKYEDWLKDKESDKEDGENE
jgi:uncharacterized protein YjbI with pentapeptide repeats